MTGHRANWTFFSTLLGHSGTERGSAPACLTVSDEAVQNVRLRVFVGLGRCGAGGFGLRDAREALRARFLTGGSLVAGVVHQSVSSARPRPPVEPAAISDSNTAYVTCGTRRIARIIPVMRVPMTSDLPTLGRAQRAETLADQTYRLVKTWMLRSAVKPNTKVTERGLAAALGVSRTPLREVFRVLEHERLIERTEKGQLVVAALSVEDIRQIHECRMRVETLAARQAAMKASSEQVEAIEMSVANAWAAYEAGDDSGLVGYNADFHHQICEAAQNPWLSLIATPLQNQMFRISVKLTETHHSPVWHDEHQAISKAISAREPDEAESAMGKHVESDLALHLEMAANDEYLHVPKESAV